MKLLITGGRTYRLTEADRAFLDRLHAEYQFSVLYVGDAPGVDTDAYAWAAQYPAIQRHRFKSTWLYTGNGSATLQNMQMVMRCASPPSGIVIAFPGDRRTADCCCRAAKAGLQIIYVHAEKG